MFSEAARSGLQLGPNDDELVLSSLSKAEFVDYANAEAHRLGEAAQCEVSAFSDVVKVRKGMRDLDVSMRSASCYGELAAFFTAAWEHFGIAETCEATERDLALQTAVIEEHQERTRTRLGNVLAVIFGLVGASAVGEKLVEPLLEYSHMVPSLGSWAPGVAYLVAGAWVLVLVVVTALLVRPRRVR